MAQTVKNLPAMQETRVWSPGEGNGTPLQYSCLENSMDRGAWWAAVHGVAESWTRLSDFTFTFHFHALEKEMATHSGVLAWRISGMGEPGGLPSLGLHRVGHDWSDSAAAAAALSKKRTMYIPNLKMLYCRKHVTRHLDLQQGVVVTSKIKDYTRITPHLSIQLTKLLLLL